MRIRTGYLSAYHRCGLDGFKVAHETLSKQFSRPATDLDLIFYATAFQAGIDRFLVDAGVPQKEPIPVAAERIKTLTLDKYARHTVPVLYFFGDVLRAKGHNEQNLQLRRLAYFLMDLYVCMATESCQINTLTIPSAEPLRGSKYEILFEPVSTLFAQLVPYPVLGSVPEFTMSRDSLRRLEDILNGRLFGTFRNVHSGLEDPAVKANKTIARIKTESARLVLRHPKLLGFSSVGLSILRATPKIIDLAFGKLAAILGEAFFETADKFFKKEKNIIIYHTVNMLRNQLTFAVNEIVQKQDRKG